MSGDILQPHTFLIIHGSMWSLPGGCQYKPKVWQTKQKTEKKIHQVKARDRGEKSSERVEQVHGKVENAQNRLHWNLKKERKKNQYISNSNILKISIWNEIQNLN